MNIYIRLYRELTRQGVDGARAIQLIVRGYPELGKEGAAQLAAYLRVA